MSPNEQNYDSLYESLKNQLDAVELDKVNFDDTDSSVTSRIADQQKVFFWIRVYLREEDTQLASGDDITIKYIPLNEELTVKFVYYAKKGLDKDLGDNVVNYNTEDDKKVICLMVDSTQINYNDSIKFLRTLFKQGYHYEYQLLRRNELEFVINKNSQAIDYYDVDF